MLELIKKVNKNELVEVSDSEYVNDILSLVDSGNLSNNDTDILYSFINNCIDKNDNIINNYYVYNLEYEKNIAKELYSMSDNNTHIRNLLTFIKGKFENIDLYDIKNSDIQKVLYLHLKDNIKGIRETTPINKLISEYLKVNFCDNNLISKYNEMLIEKVSKKYILYIGNTPLSQLTSSYSENYSSCYNLERGEYRASNIFLMNDFKNHIVKVFEYNNTNLSMIDNDTLKSSDSVISRFNLWIDKNTNIVLGAKNYGDTSYYLNKYSLRLELINELTNNLYDFTSNLLHHENISYNDISNIKYKFSYCCDFEGYQDYLCNFRLVSDNVLNYSECHFTIGKSELITWNIDTPNMIIYNNCRCADCGCSCDDDELYFCWDTDDSRCCDCCWYCEYNDRYYSNETRAIRTPDGMLFPYSMCEIY